jgi:hypothetical protein
LSIVGALFHWGFLVWRCRVIVGVDSIAIVNPYRAYDIPLSQLAEVTLSANPTVSPPVLAFIRADCTNGGAAIPSISTPLELGAELHTALADKWYGIWSAEF